MMSSYVCRQCRGRIVQHLPALRHSQWQSRATFISLRNEPTPDTPREANQHNSIQEAPLRTPDSEDISQGPTIRRTYAGRQDRPTNGGRYSKYVPGGNATAQEPTPRDAKFAEVAIDPPEITDPYASRIDKLLRRRDLSGAWTQFLLSYPSKDCPALTEPAHEGINLTPSSSMFTHLLHSTLSEFGRGRAVPPTPTAVLHQFELLGIQRPEHWNLAIRRLTHMALAGIASARPDAEAIIAELLSVWRFFFQCKGTLAMPLETLDTEWKSMPDADKVRELMADPTVARDFNRRLQSFHPNSVGNTIMGFSALTVFALLKEQSVYPSIISQDVRTQHLPFLRLLTGILPGSNTRSLLMHMTVSGDFKRLNLPEDFVATLSKQISDAPSAAMSLIGEQGFSNEPMSEAQKATAREQFLLKRIERTVTEKAHQDRLLRLWQETLRAFSVEGKVEIPLIIYNAFLTGFLTLFAPDQSVNVWNHMIEHGVKPDVTTWTSVLTGCSQARDWDGINNTWDRMIRTGVRPDNYAWTTRVNGLISLRQITAGFSALDEMGRLWRSGEPSVQNDQKQSKNHAKARDNPYPKPSIEVINGAISALAKLRERAFPWPEKRDHIHRVLQWAGSYNIKPDAYTYNTLIKIYLHANEHDTVFKLLQQMESESIPADVATYTMLLRASFDNETFAALSPAAQTSHVISLFTQLESSGIRLSTVIYSSTIDRLLKHHQNFPAVRAVIDHMLSRNMNPGAYIYTSLFTHYFQSVPPNIQAADSLWLQILQTPGTATDKFLFERIIEGYASVGEVGKMMTVLTQMSKHGKLPGWQALVAVVRALVQAGDWERARSVVADVESGVGVARGGITGGLKGQEHFFYVVGRELGLGGTEMGDHEEQQYEEEVKA